MNLAQEATKKLQQTRHHQKGDNRVTVPNTKKEGTLHVSKLGHEAI